MATDSSVAATSDVEFEVKGLSFIATFGISVIFQAVVNEAEQALGRKLKKSERLTCGYQEPCTKIAFTFAPGLNRQELVAGRIDLKRAIAGYLAAWHASEMRYPGVLRQAVWNLESDEVVNLEIIDLRTLRLIATE